MEHKPIWDAIEAQHWDVEKTFIPDGIEVVNDESLMMIQNHHSNSIYANKVVRCRGDLNTAKLVERVNEFFQDRPYSWWLGPQDKHDLDEYLINQGWLVEDEYEGLALELEQWETLNPTNVYNIKEVVTDQEIGDLVSIAAGIWGYDEKSKQAVFNERKAYITLPDRRGSFFIAYSEEGLPAAYGNDRYSEDGSVLYLKGSATLPEHRGKGLYTALVNYRLSAAKRKGTKLVTVQARVGTSEPILKKLGFQSYGMYRHFVKSTK